MCVRAVVDVGHPYSTTTSLCAARSSRATRFPSYDGAPIGAPFTVSRRIRRVRQLQERRGARRRPARRPPWCGSRTARKVQDRRGRGDHRPGGRPRDDDEFWSNARSRKRPSFAEGDADRVVVQLDTFYQDQVTVITAISDGPSVGQIDTGLRLPATGLALKPADNVDLLIEFVDLDQHSEHHHIEEGAPTIGGDNPGILLARKAAADLGAQVGDTITLVIRSERNRQLAIVETPLVVAAIHANPIRTFAFLDISDAAQFELAGLVNVVQAYPADDTTRSDVQRAVFGLPGVASSQPVTRIGEAIDKVLDQFLSFLFVTAGAVLILAFLIAFNATACTVDGRPQMRLQPWVQL